MTNETRNTLENLVAELTKGTKKVFYCSMAELSERNFSLNMTISQGVRAGRNGELDKALDILLVAMSEPKVSTETLSYLIYTLIDMNEFYYAGMLIAICSRYFERGNFYDVYPGDRPYVNAAKEIAVKRFISMHSAFTNAAEGNYYALEQFVLNTGFKSHPYNPLHKNKKDILNDIFGFVTVFGTICNV